MGDFYPLEHWQRNGAPSWPLNPGLPYASARTQLPGVRPSGPGRTHRRRVPVRRLRSHVHRSLQRRSLALSIRRPGDASRLRPTMPRSGLPADGSRSGRAGSVGPLLLLRHRETAHRLPRPLECEPCGPAGASTSKDVARWAWMHGTCGRSSTNRCRSRFGGGSRTGRSYTDLEICHSRGVSHHFRHWADDGPIVLSNLVLLCRLHHGMIHQPARAARRLRPPAARPTGDTPRPRPTRHPHRRMTGRHRASQDARNGLARAPPVDCGSRTLDPPAGMHLAGILGSDDRQSGLEGCPGRWRGRR